MLSLWCRTAGSRASNVGAALGDERCQGVTCHRYDRAVYLTAKRGLSKTSITCHRDSNPEKGRRDVVVAFSIRALSPTQAYKRCAS